MGWASGFRAGSDVARQAIDTYRDANQRRALGRVGEAKPEEVQGYSAEDGAQLEAIANARDENGNPYYQVEPGSGAGYGVRSNFQVQGEDGAMSTPGVANVAPRKMTDFLGQRYEGALDARGLDNARTRAYADVIARDDPIKGMQMRRELAGQERDEKRFEHEVALQPLKQRRAEQEVSAGDRTERTGQRADLLQTIDDEIAKMPADALAVYAAGVNTNKSNLPLLYTGTTKDGFQFLTRDPETGKPGKPVTYSEAQMRDLARVGIYRMSGFGAESQELLRSTDKELYEMLFKDSQLTASTVQSGNDARSKQHGLENDNARLGMDRERLGLERQRVGIAARSAADARGAARKPHWVSMDDGQGGSVYVDMNNVASKDGVAQLPVGVRPAGKPVDQAAVVTMASKFVESGMKDPDNPAQPISMEKALEVATSHARGRPYVSAQERLVDEYVKAKGGKTEPAPAPTKPAGRGLLTNKQGETQLLEPFTRLNDFRKRMLENDNGNHGY